MGPIFRKLDGVPNGYLTLFETPTDYVAGSVQIFLNGILLEKGLDNGWSEGGGRKILMKVAPLAGDTLQAFYLSI